MDQLLFNGKFVTLEDVGNEGNGIDRIGSKNNGIVSALLIRDERIAALGTLEEVQRHTSADTQRIDMQGKTVLPGIIDSHNHIISAGIAMGGVLLFGAGTISDACERIRARADAMPEGEWLEGAGWIESQFTENRPISLEEMDRAAPKNPLILHRLFGGSLANSRALELAGIVKGSGQPPRGEIVRNADGNPTGYLKNGAQTLVTRMIPRNNKPIDSLEEEYAAIKRATDEYIKYGITTILDPGVPPRNMHAFHTMYKTGQIPLRITMMPVWHGLDPKETYDPDALLQYIGVTEGFGDERLRIGPLKMAIDGGIGSKTAMMNEPWKDGSRTTIPLRLDIEKLEDYFREGHNAGWSIGVHCCGDLAQDIAVSTFDKVIGERERAHRHHIIHGYFPTEKSLEIMARRDIGVSVQPGFIYVEGDIYEENLDAAKVNTFKPLRTYLNHGIRVFANSDMTSAHYNPFYGICSAVTRRTSQGKQLGDSECVTVEEALPMFIKNGAWYCGLEDSVGSLKVGKQADLAVLDRDLLTIPSNEIMDVKVVQTFIGGKMVYSSMV